MAGAGAVGGKMRHKAKKEKKEKAGGSLLGEILGFGMDAQPDDKKKMSKKMVGGGVVGGKAVKPLPKKTNPLSQFYQFNELPPSNMASGGALVGGIYPLDEEQGGGLMDNILPLLPLALL